MRGLVLLALCLCLALTTSELVGPDDQKDEDNEKEIEKNKKREEAELLIIKKAIEDERSKFDPETLKELEAALSKELDEALSKEILTYKEYVETLKTTKEVMQGEDSNKLNSLKQMQYTLRLLKSTRIKHPKPTWLQDRKPSELSDHPDIEIFELEKPQLILDSLPPVTEEGDEKLTPELLEAKFIYDTAITKLQRRTPNVKETIGQIKQAAATGYVPAQIKMAWCHLFGEGVTLDITKAKEMFEELAERGNAEAHAGLGFLHAAGAGVAASQARALVHYTLGALGGSAAARMALGYRHWAAVSVPGSCPKALDLYMKVAAQVASRITFAGGPAVIRTRLTDEPDGGSLDTDLIEYYQLLAEKGDVQAQVGLGQLHFQGGRGVVLDINKALHYFTQASKTGNAVANAFLGKIYLEGGDGINPDNETALRYFKKSAELNNPVGQSGLGLMYLQGRGVEKDPSVAFKYFTMAANQGWVDGQLHLGFMYFSGIGIRRDFKQANKYFSLASQSGHVLALYHLGQMHAQGLGVVRSCTTAVELYKNVCERGPWAMQLMTAHGAWRRGDSLAAWLQYLALADQGYEVAQSNAAYMLDAGEVTIFPESERYVRALQLWSRAAKQGCSAARVKLGDYHFYGYGTARDLEAAAHHYRIASDQLHNAQAMFNLGYMHERGLGLARDLHLAKRCYDLAAETSPDAKVPSVLALAALAVGSAFDSLYVSPLGYVFLHDRSLVSNWDVYAITLFAGLIALLAYWRRLPEARPQPQPQPQQPPHPQPQPQQPRQPQQPPQPQPQPQTQSHQPTQSQPQPQQTPQPQQPPQPQPQPQQLTQQQPQPQQPPQQQPPPQPQQPPQPQPQQQQPMQPQPPPQSQQQPPPQPQQQ